MISIVAGRVTLLSFVLPSNACAPISTTGRPATVFGTVSVDAVPLYLTTTMPVESSRTANTKSPVTVNALLTDSNSVLPDSALIVMV